MTLDQGIALFSAMVSFTGLFLVVLQLRDSAKMQALQSLVEIYDINRQLISLGFSHRELFQILEDANNADPVWERRYLQLWLNQFSLINSYLKSSVLETELKASLERDIADFLAMDNMRRQWRKYGWSYPASFQELVNGLIRDGDRPETDHSPLRG